MLRDQDAALSAPDMAAAHQTIAGARTAMAGTDHEKLLQAIEQIEHASSRLQEAVQNHKLARPSNLARRRRKIMTPSMQRSRMSAIRAA
jgi:hypothetical protein